MSSLEQVIADAVVGDFGHADTLEAIVQRVAAAVRASGVLTRDDVERIARCVRGDWPDCAIAETGRVACGYVCFDGRDADG